jgi:putative heme iron utilization protein
MAHKNVHPQRIHDEKDGKLLSHAQEARNLLERGDGFGMLSTIHNETKGPFGSVVNYALGANGMIMFFASQLAEHYQNIQTDDRVSLLVVDEQKTSSGDRLSLSRVTVLGKASILPKTDDLFNILVSRHPSSSKYAKWDDFVVIGITIVENIRFIKGFGEMSWIRGEEFSTTRFDSVIVNSTYAVEHMNKDHKDSVMSMVKAFANKSEVDEAFILRFDSLGFDCLWKSEPDGRTMPLRIPFAEPITDASELRKKMTEMSRQAAEILSHRETGNGVVEGTEAKISQE